MGARNAAHANSFTAASASHIRVALKDDNLGVGARPGGKASEGEPTGLDAFRGLLGRLNGKSDVELEKDQRKRDDVKLALYAGNRWKTVNFVRAGLLEHEKLRAIEETKRPEDQRATEDISEEKSKKRRKKEKKDRSSKDKKRSSAPNSDTETPASEIRPRRSKASRSNSEIDSTTPSEDQESSKKRKSKSKSKLKSKSKKRKTRESSADELPTPDLSTSETVTPSEDLVPANSGNDSSLKSGRVTDKSKEQRPVGRRFIRGRNIMQKKMALMDDRSLNEVITLRLGSFYPVLYQPLANSFRYLWSNHSHLHRADLRLPWKPEYIPHICSIPRL